MLVIGTFPSNNASSNNWNCNFNWANPYLFSKAFDDEDCDKN